MSIGIEAHPLYWPEGWTRTVPHWRVDSKFRNTFARARDDLLHEIELLRGRYCRGADPVLSTNVALRQDGLPYANQREPDDPGVAVYFRYQDRDMCFACDKYRRVWENMVAIQKTIEAIRGIERWGASDMMERAFRGFVALPHTDWRATLENPRTLTEAEDNARRLMQQYHPDRGGDRERFEQVVKARERARQELQT